jgi:UDP-N-acetylmuramoyl-tripeptide--D-alanyl-D-alanine ligase
MLPMTIKQILEVVQGHLLFGREDEIITGASTDNRRIQTGDLFVAFVGERVDGHAFVADALRQGAKAALVTKDVQPPASTGAIILVDDALRAVQELARFQRHHFDGPVIGVTGSNGKTTSKDMLAAVFGTKGPCLATAGNHNNELGLPLTLLRLQKDHESIVLEMGMRGSGQIAGLCTIGKPTAGLMTNIGQSHIELLGSEENIAAAKGELLEALPATGVAALCRDDPWLVKIAPRMTGKVLWYSLTDQTDAYATEIETTPDGIAFTAHVLGDAMRVTLPTYGRHNVTNALGALLLGAAHGLPLPHMCAALAGMRMTGSRLDIRQGGAGRTVIDDSYNASPVSVRASLATLQDIARHRTTVAVLGDMYELGDYAKQGHEAVGQAVAELGIDLLVAIGPMSRWIAEAAGRHGGPKIHYYEDKQMALSEVKQWAPDDAVVLVKASRGMQLEDVVHVL